VANKALVILNQAFPVALQAGKISTNWSATLDDGVTAFQGDFVIDFGLTAALNVTAFKNAVIARNTMLGGPTLLITDIIIWGGIL
jgi:hypothetical protein